MKKLTVLIIAMQFIVVSTYGQKDTLTIDDYYIDFSVPDLSALGMLGVENDEIVRPGNLKEFAAGIANFVDTDGSIKPAYAIEWSFLKTFSQSKEYKWNKRFLARNLALTAGSSNQDSLGTRLAVGFKWVPFDMAEPIGDDGYYNLIGAYASGYQPQREVIYSEIYERISDVFNYDIQNNPTEIALNKVTIVSGILKNEPKVYKEQILNGDINDLQKFILDSITVSFEKENYELTKKEISGIKKVIVDYCSFVLSQLHPDFEDFKSFIKPSLAKIKEDYKKEHWNAFSLQLSGGWIANSPENNYNQMDTEKFSFFIGASGPTFNKSYAKIKGQWLFQAKFEDNFSNNSFLEQGFSFGGRHLLGNSDNRWSVDLLYSNTSFSNQESQEIEDMVYFRYTTGFEIKLSDGTWLELVFGGQKMLKGDKDDAILTSFGFKHALQSKRRHEIQ